MLYTVDRSSALTYLNVKKCTMMYTSVWSSVELLSNWKDPTHEFQGDLATEYVLKHPEMCLVETARTRNA